MNEQEALIAEKINQIKYKLNKYLNLKDTLKVKNYLKALGNIQNVSLEILKSTSIVECLKDIKKKEEESIKEIAGEIISKWKSSLKAEVENNRSKSDSNHKVHNENEKIDSKSPKHKLKIDSSAKDNADNQLKKRNGALVNLDSSQDLKKAKLSLNEYKQKSTDDLKSKSATSFVPNKIDINDKINQSKSSYEKNSTMSCIVPMPDVPLKSILPIKYSNSSNSKQQSYNYSSSIVYNKNENLNNSQNEDDGLAQILSSKHSKRILYTGRKTHASHFKMKSLFELSVQVLINTLDELPHKISIFNSINEFPIAFDLIKKVIEKCNAKQLEAIEYYSPNLIADTDYIWKRIYEQEFKKTEQPEEDESYRELYYRKLDEREKELERVRNIISKSQANKPQKRQTQIATNATKSIKSISTYSSSTASSQFSSTKKSAPLMASQPVRAVFREEPIRKVSSSKTTQKMSQGKKDLMKLLKQRR